MECEMPQINSNKEQMKKIFEQTKTIAIIGCSPNPEKASNRVAVYLQNAGFKIIPVYPKEDVILGEKVYKSLSDIPKDIDVNIIIKPIPKNKKAKTSNNELSKFKPNSIKIVPKISKA